MKIQRNSQGGIKMDFRRKAVELYNQGKSIEEISNSIGFHIEDDTIKKWTNEDKVKNFKIFVYKLNKKQMKEKDKDKRRIILLQLKQELEKILEILPNDIDMKTKLMYTYINLGEIENAKKLGNELTKNAQSKEILNGLSIIEEKLENYDIAIEYIEKILTEEPNNEALRKKIARIQAKKEKTKMINLLLLSVLNILGLIAPAALIFTNVLLLYMVEESLVMFIKIF